MNSRDFCFWLQGFFEISKEPSISPQQVEVIKNHLNLVFKHEIDPAMGDSKTQAQLNHLHGPINPGDFTVRC